MTSNLLWKICSRLRTSESPAAIEENEDHRRSRKSDEGKGCKIRDQMKVDSHGSSTGLGSRGATVETDLAPCPVPVGPCDGLSQGPGEPGQWRCISGCGACCRLDPELRQEAIEALSPRQRSTYLSMVGPDGWCVHFDTGSRRCRVYTDRPDFCRVRNLIGLFGGPSADVDTVAIACCRQQIRSEYGGRGRVMRRFLRAIRRDRHP